MCGHTFCKRCIRGQNDNVTLKTCPIDKREIHNKDLIVNKALVGQIGDLEIYCRHALVFSPTEMDYVLDESGCPEKITLSKREEHENTCMYALVVCPYNEYSCGKFRKLQLEHHLQTCCYVPCPYRDRGCDVTGRSNEVSQHQESCDYKGVQFAGSPNIAQESQIHSLQTANKLLKDTLKKLSARVETLEQSNSSLSTQLAKTTSALNVLQSQYTVLCEKVEKLSSTSPPSSAQVYRSNSDRRHRERTGSTTEKRLSRTSSSSSMTCSHSNVNSPLASPKTLSMPRVESWEMPFTFKCIGTLRGHKKPVWGLGTRKHMLYSAGEDGVIKVWDLNALTQGCVKSIRGHCDAIHCIAIGYDALYSGGADKSLRKWSLETLEEVACQEEAHDNIICAILTTSEFTFTASFSVIKVWGSSDLSPVKSILGLHHWVRGLALNYGRDRLYSGSHNCIEMWEATGKFALKGKIDHQFGSIYSLAVTSKYIIAGTYNKNLHVWDISSNQYIQALSAHIGVVSCLGVSPSGRFLFSGSHDTSVQVWNLEIMLPIQNLQRHEEPINTLILHDDLLLTGGEDSEIKVFKHFKMAPGFTPA
ncbi:unnamed protein product [Owenia fusiformis]|uniref:RING-type domain-containing protein n=1 Tax=Owenia fusiformis TaxID=6347 RepID=A0A8S4NCK2_OWEFU|nr:unnamed protein product [Owenia fusiformis]